MDDTEEKWQVWDDGLDETSAIRIRNWREREDSQVYEFRITESTHHGPPYYQVEARRRYPVDPTD